MNTVMWQHPATQRNVGKLRSDGVRIIEPDAGEMACGTIGPGRLSTPERIVSLALDVLAGVQPEEASDQSSDLAGESILITAGATREMIDPVRFISNRSSGKMGYALSEVARQRGARVRLVSGIASATPPADVELIETTSAEEMRTVVLAEFPDATVFIGAAAVADYRAKHRSETKIKKDASDLTLALERTPDILNEVAQLKTHGQLLVGFAAETTDVICNARKKLEAKNLDLVVANDVTREGSGFDSDSNEVTILVRDNARQIDLPLMSKLEVANRILDEIVRLRRRTAGAKSAPNS